MVGFLQISKCTVRHLFLQELLYDTLKLLQARKQCNSQLQSYWQPDSDVLRMLIAFTTLSITRAVIVTLMAARNFMRKIQSPKNIVSTALVDHTRRTRGRLTNAPGTT